MDEETWKAVPGWENFYEVSDEGRVWSRVGDRFLRQSPNNRAYLKVSLSNPRWPSVHVAHLVAIAFIGPRPEGLMVLHNNDDKWDNRLPNLRYGTHSDNVADAVQNDRWKRGSRVGMRVGLKSPRWIDVDEVAIHKLRSQGLTCESIGKELGVSRFTVSRVLRSARHRSKYSHNIGGDYGPPSWS